MTNNRTYKKQWPLRNLVHMHSFITRFHPEGLNLKSISEKTGLSQSMISHYFVKDDMPLKKCEEIARTYGYRLTLFFPYSEFLPQHPETMREYPNAGNLQGLVTYLSQRNITLNHLRLRIHKSPTMMKKALETGNIKLSMLYLVARELKIHIEWEFEKINN